MHAFSDGLLIPALVLALVGWLVPRGLSLVWPEGVRPLLLLAFVAMVIMFFVSEGVFVLLYISRGANLLETGMAHFVRLGAISALIWGPILILSVSGLPKHWVKETW